MNRPSPNQSDEPRFKYLCATCGVVCYKDQATDKGLGKFRCPAHKTTKVRRERAKEEAKG